MFLKNKNNKKINSTALFLFSKKRNPASRCLQVHRLVVCPWAKCHVNIQVAAPLPRGVCPTEPGGRAGGRAGGRGWPSGSGVCPPRQLLPPLGWVVLCLFFAAEPQEDIPRGDHSVAHTEAMTIMRWGEMLEMLARRSGARRDR